jgi:pimeloyl-ACP methyl ester carboxylesterase
MPEFLNQTIQRFNLAFALGFLALLCACSPRTVQKTRPAAPGIHLEPCQISAPGTSNHVSANCGTLTVYEDRAAGSGRQIDLNIAVVRAVSRSPEADPLFFIPGGPGEAATESYPLLASAFNQINQKRDIILVDQRGTGKSHPLQCPEDPGNTQAANDPGPQEIQTELKKCLALLNSDPRFYTTAIAMDDLDQVRATLGYDKINLYGGSYGTRAALAYMRQHPDHVRSVILDGINPTDWSLGLSSPADAQRALDAILERCNAEADCHAAFPNVKEEFAALLKRLDQEAVSVELDHPVSGERTSLTITRDVFANTIHQLSYTPESAALLPLLIHSAYARNDYGRLAALTLSNTSQISSSLSPGMRFSVICSEDQPFFAGQALSEGYLGDMVTRSFDNICQAWPHGVIPTDFKQPVRSAIPTLLISGELDPATPPSNGEQVARTLSNSLHLIAPGMGHINIFRGCIPKIAYDFIDQGSVSNLETACVQELRPMPFFLNFNGPTP